MVPRSEVAECQRISQVLRAENARYKDQNLALQAQNRDLADRAVDDYRRLAEQEQTIERLKESNLAYQNDRSQLETAFKQLKANLGDPTMSTASAVAWPSADGRSPRATRESSAGSRSLKGSASNDESRIR
jgi:hypothetical protein